MKFLCYIITLLVLLGYSCKKKEFPETVVETESAFYFNATVNGVPVSLKSGINNYFMYSSMAADSSNVYLFTADLKPENCNNCANAIQIKISDFKESLPNESAKIDSSLTVRNYPLSGKGAYLVSFQSNYNQTAANYLWDFGDKTISTQANPTHTFSSAGNYNVSLRITGTTNCQQYMKKTEKIKIPYKSCDIEVLSNSLNTIHCKPIIQGTNASKYLWDFGDGFRTDTFDAHHTYPVAGTYPITLRVIDASGDTLNAKYNHATQTNPLPCLTNYKITSVIPFNDNVPFRKITITWTDENGLVYTSNNFSQPDDSYFKILSVEEFERNERNEKTKKIKVQFKCKVYNGISTKTIDNVEAVVCVAYK